MIRIALVQLGYESNTFSARRAHWEELGPDGWIAAGTVAERFTGTHTGIGGVLDGAAAQGAQVVPMDLLSRNGAFNAGSIVDDQVWRESVEHICSQLARHAAEYDGVCAAIHGAACTDTLDDADGYFLRRVRETVGDKPITAFMDLHAVVTPEMLEMTDALFGVKTYPHVDFYEMGRLAAEMLIKTLRGAWKPAVAWVPLPMLVQEAFSTTVQGVGKAIRDYVTDYAANHGLVDATFFHGFSTADTAHACACVVAVADGRMPEEEAREMARHIWSLRHEFDQPCRNAAQAVDAALAAVKNGYVVINETSDNPGGGCPGDGTHLLAELLRRDLAGSIFSVICDPAAAEACHRAGVGAKLRLQVGGHNEKLFGDPLDLKVEVLGLSDGTFTCASPMYPDLVLSYGPAARVRCGHVEIVLVTRRMQTYDDRPILMTGGRMEDYRIVALKSSNHFRAYFKDTADAIITADTPGLFPADPRKLDYRKVRRPIFPLDEDMVWDDRR